MIGYLGHVAALVSYGLLLVPGIGHLRQPGRTILELTEQRIWPRGTVPVIYAGLVGMEVTVGGVGLASVAFDKPAWPGVFAQTGAVTLYLAFTGYGVALLRWRPQAPCGCSGRRQPVSGWTVTRSAVLLGCSAAAFLAAGAIDVGIGTHTVLALLAGLVFAVLIWRLPDAMTQPEMRMS